MPAKAASSKLADKRKAILTNTHPIYEANKEEWLRNERRHYGGIAVLSELARWNYEEEDTEEGQYADRLRQAIYVNFPALYTSIVAGHIAAAFPSPGVQLSFGSLGEVPRERNRSSPSRAELLYYNVDGIGTDGSQWNNYWRDVLTRAIATGHRWMYVDTPSAPLDGEGVPRQPTQADELQGFRPFLREYSPLMVPDWHDENGQLRYAVVKINARSPKLGDDGKVAGSGSDDGYLFLSAAGFDGYDLGGKEDFSLGGWWIYDAEFELLEFGSFDSTDGRIPFFPHFWQRSSGVPEELPAMSRSGIFEQGQAAVSWMNLNSAATFDAIDAAKSVTILTNVDKDGFELFNELLNAGSQVTVVKPAAGSTHAAGVADGSTGAVPAQVFESALARIERVARFVSALNAMSVPDSSGQSKSAGFAEGMGPRLSAAASELEQAWNSAITFFEWRWGNTTASGSATLPRKFDLIALQEKIETFYRTLGMIGIRSKTLDVQSAMKLGREADVIGDDATSATIETELKKSAADRDTRQAQMASALGDLNLDDPDGGAA